MPVHNHRPDEGEGLGCPETRVNGVLQGECLRKGGVTMNEISRELQERLQLAEKQHEELAEALGDMRYKKDFTFSLVVSAIDLDDAIAQLRSVGHDVDDLGQVRWLD